MKRQISAFLLILTMVLAMLSASALADGPDGGARDICTCTEPCTPLTNATTSCPVCKTSGHWENGVYVYDSGVTVTEKNYTDAGGTNSTIKVADYAYLKECNGLKDTVYVDSSSYNPSTNPQGDGEGTENNPYQNLQMAVYGVKPGGTIIIVGDTVVSTAPAIHPYPGNVRYNVLELDRPVTIISQNDKAEYAGKVTTNSNAGFIDGSWTGQKNSSNRWDSFRTNNVIDGSVVFDGISFTHTGGDIISQYSVGSDLSKLDLTIQNCAFTNIQSGSAIRISRNIKSVTIKNTDFTVTSVPDTDGYKKAYVVWTDSTQSLTISECKFDGNGTYRAAVHVGNGHLSGTTTSITYNKFTGFERCIQLALINSAKNTTTISNNIFENIQLSTAINNTTNAYEYGAIFIHESHQKNGNFDSSITLTENQLTGTSDRWIYTENTFPIEYFNISMDGKTVENMDFHRHLSDDAVTYYPKYPVLAPVTDSSGYGGYILKTVNDAFTGASDGDTLSLLRDVTLNGVNTPESTTADVQINNDLTLVLAPEITFTALENANHITVNADKTLTLSGWYEYGAMGNDGESGGAIVIGDEALLTVNGTLYNRGNIVLKGEDNTNLVGEITLRLGGEVYSKLSRDAQILNWIKYEDKPYYTSGVSEGYNPKYVYYGPTVSPVDITVYKGGEVGYDGVVGEENGNVTIKGSTSLPIPGFTIELPDTLETALAASGEDITDLRFVSGTKQWKAVSYDGKSDTIYKLESCGFDGQGPVRVQFKDGDTLVDSDDFSVGEYINQTLDMSIYPGDPGDPVTSVTITYDGYTYDVDFSAIATLTVRGTTIKADTPIVAKESDVELKEKEPAVTAPDGTAYIINGNDVQADSSGIALLFDSIIEETPDSTARIDALEAKGDETLGDVATNHKRHYEFKYLDLVDTNNGNAWVTAVDTLGNGQNVTVYWPLPEGTTKNTDFTLLHFEGLHRDMQSDQIQESIDSCTVNDDIDIKDVTDTHVVFEVGSAGFSPFALVWETSAGGGTTYYMLSYESNGGTTYGNENYASGTTIELNKVPTREGYTFTGWYSDPELTQKITNIKMTSNKTVYAGWKISGVPEWLNGDDHFAYIIGFPDGSVGPEENITRAEVATIFFRLLTDEVRTSNLTDKNSFSDVNTDDWYNTEVSTMEALGILKGRTSDTFEPNAPITRAEFAAICARFNTERTVGDSNFADIDGHWAEAEIERAVVLGWITAYPDGTFRPDNYINRAEAMTMINRVLQRLPENESDLLKDMIVWPDNSPEDWYYLAVQEATNSHEFKRKSDDLHESWTKLTEDPDWTQY